MLTFVCPRCGKVTELQDRTARPQRLCPDCQAALVAEDIPAVLPAETGEADIPAVLPAERLGASPSHRVQIRHRPRPNERRTVRMVLTLLGSGAVLAVAMGWICGQVGNIVLGENAVWGATIAGCVVGSIAGLLLGGLWYSLGGR